ncbi:hypothetical protein [Deinococcus phoenicis]|uniref:hypothetical protein n=1 Tax=Deinococcus phoenicis TaxID=1476583 RepID=UPI0004AD8EE8|nr:hypothetical protein [Deinococcus phoenicis]
MRQPPTEAGGLRPLPPTEVEVRPELTDDLRAFWVRELRGLSAPHQAAMLTSLVHRYGQAAADEIKKAVGA